MSCYVAWKSVYYCYSVHRIPKAVLSFAKLVTHGNLEPPQLHSMLPFLVSFIRALILTLCIFLQFKDLEDAKDAMSKLNGSTFKGRKITVEYVATGAEDRTRDSSPPPRRDARRYEPRDRYDSRDRRDRGGNDRDSYLRGPAMRSEPSYGRARSPPPYRRREMSPIRRRREPSPRPYRRERSPPPYRRRSRS